MQYHVQLYKFKNNGPEKLHSQKKKEEEEKEKGLVFIILKLHLYNKGMSKI